MLGLKEIGLHNAVNSWILQHNSGALWVIKKVTASPTPFQPPTISYVVVLKTVAVSVDQLSSEHTRRLFGSTEATYYRATIPLADSMLTDVKAGHFCVIDYAGLEMMRGTLERIERELDGAAVLYINSSEAVPQGAISKAT